MMTLLALTLLAAKFDPVPTPEGGKPNGLLIRVVKYDGSTNGAITVEVKNPGTAIAAFDAKGLYFVPAVNPEQAPQRLGAVGPFTTRTRPDRAEMLELQPGASEQLTLDVYCIDSHRSSPTSETPFRVAKTRMPRQLSTAIEKSTAETAAPYGGVTAPTAKSAVQGEVWKTRDGKWIKLDGESAQEATK
jgi:hypothetical protein